MKFVFWQNIISIHQSAFLNALSEKHEIVLVVEKKLERERIEQGWNIPGLKRIKTLVAPSQNQMYELLDNSAIHVFSGLSAYPMVNKAFRYAIKKGLKTGVLLEPFKWVGVKGKIRWLKYYFLKVRFGKTIDFLATTGEIGTLQYTNIGFDKRKVFEWGYFVESPKLVVNYHILNVAFRKPSVLFVGRIDERKNIIPQLETIKKLKNQIQIMTIVGDGPLKGELQSKINGHSIFDYKGNLPNLQVKKLMASHDILILPSKFDGWGAVINEALHEGMQVIASENCGASVLLDGKMRGEKFELNKEKSFETVLVKWANKGALRLDDRYDISTWSQENISGKAAANYFIQIVEYVFFKTSERPLPPWRKEY